MLSLAAGFRRLAPFPFTALASLVAFAAPCEAQNYLPLGVGNRWSYDNHFGLHEEQHVTRTIELFGRTAYVIRYENSDVNEGLENFWWTDPSGDLHLCGFHRTKEEYGRVYDPPILWLDAPLVVGKSWSTNSDTYEYPSLESAGTIGLGLEVDSHILAQVPAGTYESYGITQFVPAGGLVAANTDFAVDGTSWGWVGPTYYSEDVGVVVYDTYVLSSPPVPAGAVSWGRIKSDYRE